MGYVSFDEIGKTRKFVLISLLSSMGILMDGYSLSIFSTAELYLHYTFLSKAIYISVAASAIYIGMFLGSIIFGRMAHTYGRKRYMFMISH